MKLTEALLAVIAALVVTGCAGGKLAESGKTDNFSYSFVGIETDQLTKRGKAVFLLVNESTKNIGSIIGTYQIIDKEGNVIETNSFTKDEYPYLLQAGQKRKMSVTSGTLPSTAVSMRIKVKEIRYK